MVASRLALRELSQEASAALPTMDLGTPLRVCVGKGRELGAEALQRL